MISLQIVNMFSISFGLKAQLMLAQGKVKMNRWPKASYSLNDALGISALYMAACKASLILPAIQKICVFNPSTNAFLIFIARF